MWNKKCGKTVKTVVTVLPHRNFISSLKYEFYSVTVPMPSFSRSFFESLSTIKAIAPSPVTLHAVPNESIAM